MRKPMYMLFCAAYLSKVSTRRLLVFQNEVTSGCLPSCSWIVFNLQLDIIKFAVGLWIVLV
jgi:hypothetical protein